MNGRSDQTTRDQTSPTLGTEALNDMAFAGAEKMWLKLIEAGLIDGSPPQGFASSTRWCAYVGRLAWHEENARCLSNSAQDETQDRGRGQDKTTREQTSKLPITTAPRDGRWITLHLPMGQVRAAWMTPSWSVTRDPTDPDWMDEELRFADAFNEATGWTQ